MRNLIYWAIGFIILVIILFFVLRKPKMKPMSEPSMIWGESYYEISPIEDTNVENYQIEYAGPPASTPTTKYSDNVLTSLVKVTVFWKNKYGFEDVTKIRITRTLGNNSSNVEVEKSSTVTGGANSDKQLWFENFNRTFNTYTFEEPNNTTKNFMGTNTFKIEYITSGSTYRNVTGINHLELPLNRNDIQLKLDTQDFTNVVFTPNIKAGSKVDPEYVIEGYFLYPDFSPTFVYPLPYAFGETANNKFNFTVDQNDNKKVNVNYGGEYIKIDTDTKLKLETGKNNAIQFDLLKPNSKQNILILGILDTNKTNFEKVFILKKNAAAREAHLVDFNSINDEDEYKTMFLSFSTTSLGDGNQDCAKTPGSIEPCITNINGHSASFEGRNISVSRGEQVERITIDQEQTGSGECVHRGVDIIRENAIKGVYKTGNKVLLVTKCPVNCQKRIDGFDGKCRGKFGNCINTSESGTFPATDLWTDDEPAVNGGTCPSVTGTVSCINGATNTFNSLSPAYTGMLGRCNTNCPAATATPTSPTCNYNAGGRADTPASQNVTWVSQNGKNCNHVPTPATTTIPVPSCGGLCHVPNWKAKWEGCDSDNGGIYDILDENRWSRKTGQPICNGSPDYTGWTVYNQDTDNQGTFMCRHDDDYGWEVKWSKDNDTDINAAKNKRFNFTFNNNPVNRGIFTPGGSGLQEA